MYVAKLPMELPPPAQAAKGREPPSMSCGHKINMVVRHAQARLESSRNVELIFFFKAKMVDILRNDGPSKKVLPEIYSTRKDAGF